MSSNDSASAADSASLTPSWPRTLPPLRNHTHTVSSAQENPLIPDEVCGRDDKISIPNSCPFLRRSKPCTCYACCSDDYMSIRCNAVISLHLACGGAVFAAVLATVASISVLLPTDLTTHATGSLWHTLYAGGASIAGVGLLSGLFHEAGLENRYLYQIPTKGNIAVDVCPLHSDNDSKNLSKTTPAKASSPDQPPVEAPKPSHPVVETLRTAGRRRFWGRKAAEGDEKGKGEVREGEGEVLVE